MLPLRDVRTWSASEFPRARQTASLLMGVSGAELIVDSRLNELDYGEFEGAPFLEYASWLSRHGGWQRPPGGRESQREGVLRMLSGIRGALEHPGPRVLVCHGLLVSVLIWHRDRSPGTAMPLFFPEAACVEPLAISDETLHMWTATLLAELEAMKLQDPDTRSSVAIPQVDHLAVATFDQVARSSEKKDFPHA